MKKIVIVLILALAAALSAGCVSDNGGTAQTNDDPLIGTWGIIEPIENAKGLKCDVTLNVENKGGTLTNKFSDGVVGELRIVWNKDEGKDNSYTITYFNALKLSEDGKTMTASSGETFSGGNGFSGRWVQNIDESAGYQREFVLNSDGTGTQYLYRGDKISKNSIICINEVDGYLYEYDNVEELTFSDGKMTDESGMVYSYKDGVWTWRDTESPEYCIFEFNDDKTGTSTYYLRSGMTSISNFDWIQKSENVRSVYYLSDLKAVINSDGTLTIDGFSSDFKKL
ncbi:MAG: hypothetical protein Q4Q53_02255 [Methanocorpusculum sp.]|nr:hypothetical protein [Methanocorpusculum sp.]